MPNKLSYIFLVFLLSSMLGYGQATKTVNKNEYVEDKPVLMKNEATFGLQIHSSGWGIQFRRSKNLTVSKKRIYEGDYVGMKHPKEIKTVNPYFDQAKSYVYGKENSFTVLRAGTGTQRTLYSKAERNGVEVRLQYSGGLSLGITKPVYLNILKPTGQYGEYDIVVEKYDPTRHYIDNIYGRAPFTQGIGEINFHPGLYGKLGFNFEYAPVFEDVKALEIGAILDVYPTEIPIMAFIDNKQFFLSFYITLMYGRKW
jgi:hypothetical protein